MLLHHLFVNSVHIWFMRSQALISQYVELYPSLHSFNSNEAPRPDALFEIVIDGRKFNLYMEADRGTETFVRLRDKFDSYYSVLPESGSLVLFIQAKQYRDPALILNLAEEAGILDRFLTTSYADFKHLNVFTEPIWWGIPENCSSLYEFLMGWKH